MSCLMLFLLVMVIMYFGALISFFLAVGMVPLALASLAAIPLILLLVWRIIYPWLVRMGRWSAQVANIIFLALVLTAAGIGLGYLLGAPTITLLGIELPATVLIFGLLFLFLLLLGLVVWLVRIWRYTWPISRNLFWDLLFRIVALFWRILVGIPLGVVWFLYHPPLRWLVATLLFYVRGISAGVAKALYNPPLRSIAIAVLLVSRLVGRIVSWIIYNPPISWVIEFGLFILRLMARFVSAVIYAIWSWWPTRGVRRTLGKGLNIEKKSYQQYGYAQNDGSGVA